MAKSKRKRRLAPGFTESLSSPLKSTSDSSGGKGSGVGRGAGTRTCSDRSNSIFCDDENSWWSEFSSVSPFCSISARGPFVTMWLRLLRCAIKQHWAARKSANRDANNRRSGEFCLALLLWRANIRYEGPVQVRTPAHLHTSYHEERMNRSRRPQRRFRCCLGRIHVRSPRSDGLMVSFVSF